jgi:hypothetical protein
VRLTHISRKKLNAIKYDTLINQLDDQTAVSLLSDVTGKWIAKNPGTAVQVMRQTEGYAQRQNLVAPVWVDNPSTDLAEAGSNARRALAVMVDCEDDDVRAWAQFGVTTPASAKGHVIDPVTGTLCLAGLILASRVKKIGPDGIVF